MMVKQLETVIPKEPPPLPALGSTGTGWVHPYRGVWTCIVAHAGNPSLRAQCRGG